MTRTMNTPSTCRVLFVLLPHSLTLDWAGPAEVLRCTNSVLEGMGQAPRFAMEFVGPEVSPITSVGVQLTGVAPLPDISADSKHVTWVVLVGEPGDRMRTDTPAALATLHWLRGLRLVAGHIELVTVCAGAVLAAHAGLLSGREATTHHQHLDELRQADRTCRVQANRVFVTDGPVCSSAGVTTGIDLMLHIVRSDFGVEAANSVARRLVMPPHRSGGQAQFMERPVPQEGDYRLAQLLDDVRNDLQAPAIEVAPAIGTALGLLHALDGCTFARMSGSGATCFGIFGSLAEAEAAGLALKTRQPDWWIAPALLDGQDRLAPQLIRSTT